jgi:parallel beta-helix repeat protein
MIDGFVLTASAPAKGGTYGTGLYGQGVELWDGNDTIAHAAFSVHHIWILNSIISGYGQSGINMNDGEYFFAVHNAVHNNANAGCDAQGSGIAFVELKAIPGTYKRTADDSRNHILGDIGSFNNAIAWNVVYNNATTKCGTAADPYDTDGNNIILDTLNNGNIGGTTIVGPIYPESVLVEFNVAYNAGGRGIHIFRSENVTVANNSCYNNDLDPFIDGSYRPCIGDEIGYNNVFFNNLAYAIPQAKLGVAHCGGSSKGCLAFNGAFAGGLAPGGGAEDQFFNNMSYCTSTAQPLAYGCTPMFTNNAVRTAADYYEQMSTGDSLVLAGALPAPLVAGKTYYAVKVGADQIQFAATKDDARAVPPITLGLYDIVAGSISITDKTISKTYASAVVQLDSFPTSGNNRNFVQTKPGWGKLGHESAGTESRQPVGANFALSAGSPAIGKGRRASYLSSQSVDLGACPSTVATCPATSAQPAVPSQ